jgi:hypothetical protein
MERSGSSPVSSVVRMRRTDPAGSGIGSDG